MELWLVVLLPLIGTVLGAAGVFFPGIGGKQKLLNGFAGGVMVAASVWSLILPALERNPGKLLFPLVGIWMGWAMIPMLNGFLYRLSSKKPSDTALLSLAVALHNFPEGMVVGVAAAAYMADQTVMSYGALLALSMGIALQNVPEGAILSMPLHAGGMRRKKAFWLGSLSGAAEPAAAIVSIAAWQLAVPALPFCLCFAAGTMLCVVVENLLSLGEESSWSFCMGFTVMMSLDVLLG